MSSARLPLHRQSLRSDCEKRELSAHRGATGGRGKRRERDEPEERTGGCSHGEAQPKIHFATPSSCADYAFGSGAFKWMVGEASKVGVSRSGSRAEPPLCMPDGVRTILLHCCQVPPRHQVGYGRAGHCWRKNPMKLLRNTVLTAFLLAATAGQARAQFESVGVIDFPTSATGEAQDHFLRASRSFTASAGCRRASSSTPLRSSTRTSPWRTGESRWPTTTRSSRRWTPPSRARLSSDWPPPGPSASPRRRRIARGAF